MSSGEGFLRNAARALERVNEESSGSGSNTPSESDVVRPLEDPYLVGEVAAARARRERLARENGPDVLHSEDRRWDWFLGKSSSDGLNPFAPTEVCANLLTTHPHRPAK